VTAFLFLPLFIDWPAVLCVMAHLRAYARARTVTKRYYESRTRIGPTHGDILQNCIGPAGRPHGGKESER
jgi:hypothetical protein